MDIKFIKFISNDEFLEISVLWGPFERESTPNDECYRYAWWCVIQARVRSFTGKSIVDDMCGALKFCVDAIEMSKGTCFLNFSTCCKNKKCFFLGDSTFRFFTFPKKYKPCFKIAKFMFSGPLNRTVRKIPISCV